MGGRTTGRRWVSAVLAVVAATSGLAFAGNPATARNTVAADAPLGAPETVLPAGVYAWSLDVDSAGNAYIGGHDSVWNPVILRVAPDGTRTSIATTDGSDVGSIAVGPDDTVYLGTLDGIERIAPGGARSTIAVSPWIEPDAIAVAPDGAIWFTDGWRIRRRAPSGSTTTVTLSKVGRIADIAVGPDGSLFALDAKHKSVVRRTPAGVQTSLVSLGTMPTPLGISVDAEGTLRVADGGRILVRVDAGTVTRPSVAPFTTAGDVVVGADGTLYVLDSSTGRLLTRPPSGPDRVSGEIGAYDADDLAVGADGSLWIGEYRRVAHHRVDGTTTFTSVPDGWVMGAIAATFDGSLVVALNDDRQRGQVAIWTVHDSGLSSLEEWPDAMGLRDVAVGPDGTVYLADSTDPGGRVVARSPGGVTRTMATGYWPSSVAVDPAGTVYYADDGYSGGRVVAVSPLGAKRVLAIRGGWNGGLDVDAAGRVYAMAYTGDGSNQSFSVQSPGGAPVVATSWTPGEFKTLYRLVAGPDGTVYSFVNDEVVRLSAAVPSVPAAPLVTSVVGGAGQVAVGWSRPPDHRSAITGFEVIPAVDGVAQPAVAFGADQTSGVVDGLDDGTTYTFTVRATNGMGTGPSSWTSNAVTPGAVRFAPFTGWDRFVAAQLNDFASSPGSTAARSLPVAVLAAGQATPASYINGLRVGAWFHPHVAPVTRLYLAYFQRTPDPGGLRYWSDAHRKGRSLNQISATFAASAEFTRTYGNLTDGAFVDLIYANVLGRSPDAGGGSYWVGKLGKGTSRGAVMASFSESSEFVRQTDARVAVIEVYLAMLGRRPTTSELTADAARPITTVIDAIRLSPAYQAAA